MKRCKEILRLSCDTTVCCLAIDAFLTQEVSKRCINTLFWGPSLKIFDAVAEMFNTAWCGKTRKNITQQGYEIYRGTFLLLRGMVVYNIRAVVFQR